MASAETGVQTSTLLAFDPGMSTGWCHGTYTVGDPWRLERFGQIEGGLGGLMPWLHWENPKADTVISERFVPLAGQGFSHTAKSVEPLRVEGALVALGYLPADTNDPRWQRPASQYWVSGKNATEKRRKQKAWVKENHPELYKTGKKDLGTKDAEDYWSALFHSLAYMRKIGHEPTIRHYWPERKEAV